MSKQPQPPKCPKCGFVMCEQFDEETRENDMVYMIPNGEFKCYHCDKEVKP